MKRLRGIVLLILAGVFLNVLVAWGCALLIDVNKAPWSVVCSKVLNRNENWDHWNLDYVYKIREIHLQRRFGVRHYSPSSKSISYIVGDPSSIPESHSISDEGHPIGLPAWIRSDLMGGGIFGGFCEGFGWPLISFTNEMKWIERDVSKTADGDSFTFGPVVSGMELPFLPWPNGRQRVLPLRPAWRGIAANTVFYAGLLWLPLVARRMIRRRRGRCPACGYDLRKDMESGCPECGWGRAGQEA